MDILIIKLGAIGDVIRTTAILRGLIKKYPDCTISWIIKKESFDILKNNPLIDKIYLIDNLDLKDKSYGLIINLDDDEKACNLISKIGHDRIIGAFSEDGKLTYTIDSSLWFDMGLISKFGKEKADKLKAKNKKTHPEIMYEILGLEYNNQEPILRLDDDELKFGKKFANKNNIEENKLVIGINTGAGGRWQDKKLNIKQTIELIDKINSKIKATIILFGGPEEENRNKNIMEFSKSNIIDAGCNNSLMEFASLVNLCNILVTSDSLAMHIGIALKKRILAFFYSTSDTEIELYGRGIKIKGKGEDYCTYKPKCDFPPKWDIDEFIEALNRLIL